MTFRVTRKQSGRLARLGFKEDYKSAASEPVVYLSAGKRGSSRSKAFLDHARCVPHMDPRDAGISTTWAETSKRERAWATVGWDPELWKGKGLPAAIERLMTEGAVVELHQAKT